MSRSSLFTRLRKLMAVGTWANKNGIDASEAEERFLEFVATRRDVLKALAATATLMAVPVLPACGSSASNSETKVAVVGGGIAGLHCAWRLKEAGVKVTLYDAQDRVGGRMWTAREQFDTNLLFEIGGELIDSNHATMFAIAEEFSIELDDRWSFEKPEMVRETWYVNGAMVSNETLLEQTMAIAELLASEVEAAETDDDAFETLDNTSLLDWLNANVPTTEYPELHEVLRVAFVGEYGLEADEQSVLNLHYLFGFESEEEFLIFGDSDERWHTKGGNDIFTQKLAEAIGAENIKLSHPLIKAAGTGAGPYTLTFNTAGGATEETADHVVFALPFSLLRRVDLTGLELSDDKREVITEIGYGTNAKIMGHFNSRPWWDVHNQSGLLTTDLDIQQGWDTTVGQDESQGGIWTNFVGGDQGANSGQGTAEAYFEKATDDLEVIWPGTKAAWSGKAARMHWPTFEWSRGSYTCYKPGQWAYWSTEGTREGNIHFCGEHCSLDFQGWMEGAAETGGLTAAAILMDLGKTTTQTLQQAIGPKLTRPQPALNEHGKLRWQRRSKRLASRG